MIDRVINSVLDSASPAITRWRTGFLLVGMIFLSPNLEILFATDLLLMDLEQSFSMLSDLLASSIAVVALALAGCFYILTPYLNYGVLLIFVNSNIQSAEPLLIKLESLRNKNREDIEKIIEESFDLQKGNAKAAEKLIFIYKQRAEIAIMSFMLYTICSLYLDVFSVYIAGGVVFFYLAACYWAARKVLLIYLRDIAPYKMLEDYIRYFVMVKSD